MFIVQLISQTEYTHVMSTKIKKENKTSTPEALMTPRITIILTFFFPIYLFFYFILFFLNIFIGV